MSNRKIILVFIGFVVFLSLMVYSFYASMLSDNFESRVFNSEKWKNDKNNRVELVDDLIQSKVLDTLTQAELNYLLGPPEVDPYFKASDNEVYYLGPERGFPNIDSEWLIIWFENGVVTKYEIARD